MQPSRKKFNFSSGVYEDDRRKWTRFPPEPGNTEIILEGESTARRQGTILDECVDAICVELEEASDLRVGQEVSLYYYGASMPAIIRYAHMTNNGTWRVGIQWADIRHVDL